MIHEIRKIAMVLPILFGSLLGLTSCSESSDEVEEYVNWQETNQTRWNSVYTQALANIAAGDSNWKVIKSWNIEDSLSTANTSYIVIHVLHKGTGSGVPLYTDSVRVHYKGRLLESPSYPTGYQFDSSWGSATSASTAIPAQFLVSDLTEGFATALQNMHIGDEWEVYVPWTLGYGTSTSGTIPGYSMLIFDMQLVSYYRAGYTVPDYKAKSNFSWATE